MRNDESDDCFAWASALEDLYKWVAVEEPLTLLDRMLGLLRR